MAEKRTYTYEAMFLLSQAQAADFTAAVAHVRQLMEKHGATILALRKWDERRLAFEIKKQKRGVYLLAFFNAWSRSSAPATSPRASCASSSPAPTTSPKRK
ncbi:MAG TPA: 30S ribosomal protein S6 [Phycisphaerales bacterium]|nr:30S ribosomal protein S6 [Phycisphaerales bacterium]